MATPGHTAQDITTLAATDGGLAACTHLWWSEEGPAVDLRAEDQELLERSRAKLLARASALIVPGHGEPFAPGQARARLSRAAAKTSMSAHVPAAGTGVPAWRVRA